MLGAVALGAALTYFFDPAEGARRRRLALDWLRETAERAAEAVGRAFGEPPSRTEPTIVREPTEPEPMRAREAGPLPPAAAVAGAPEVLAKMQAREPVDEPLEVATAEPEPEPDPPEVIIPEPAAERDFSEWTLEPSADEPREPEPERSPAETAALAATSRRSLPLVLAALAATAAATAAGLGVWALTDADGGGVDAATTARLQDQEQAIAVLSQRDSARIPVQGSNGRIVLVVAPSGEAVLVIQNVRRAPKGKTYEAWVIVGTTPSPAGLFAGGATRVIPLTRPVPRGAIVAVTLERAGGMQSPTTKPIYTAKRA